MNRVDGDPWGAKDGYICVEANNLSYFYSMHRELTRDLNDDAIKLEQIAWAPPIILYQSKIICTDEFWLPVWNFIVRIMQQDVDRLCWDVDFEASSDDTVFVCMIQPKIGVTKHRVKLKSSKRSCISGRRPTCGRLISHLKRLLKN